MLSFMCLSGGGGRGAGGASLQPSARKVTERSGCERCRSRDAVWRRRSRPELAEGLRPHGTPTRTASRSPAEIVEHCHRNGTDVGGEQDQRLWPGYGGPAGAQPIRTRPAALPRRVPPSGTAHRRMTHGHAFLGARIGTASRPHRPRRMIAPDTIAALRAHRRRRRLQHALATRSAASAGVRSTGPTAPPPTAVPGQGR